MKPGCHRGCSWFHRHKLTVRLVHGFAGLVEVPQVLEHLADHLLPGADHQTHHVVSERVSVLVQKTFHIVPDLTSIVLDTKLHAIHSWS